MLVKTLNGQIRKTEGSVKLELATAAGVIIVGLVKSELVAGVAALHPDNKAETYLEVVNGVLKHTDDGARQSAREVAGIEPAETVALDDFTDDLLDDVPQATLLGGLDVEDLDDLLA